MLLLYEVGRPSPGYLAGKLGYGRWR